MNRNRFSSEVADLNDITSVYERGLSSTFSPSNAIIITFLLLIADHLLNLPLFPRLLKIDRTHGTVLVRQLLQGPMSPLAGRQI